MHFRFADQGYFTGKPCPIDQATHAFAGLPLQIFGPSGQVLDYEVAVGWQSRTVAMKQARRWVTSGVHWHAASSRWQVRIQTNTLSVCGGYYTDLEEAEACANMLRSAHGLYSLHKFEGDFPPDVGSAQWCRENFILDELGILYRVRINGSLLRTRLSSRSPNVRELDALLHAVDILKVLRGELPEARVINNVDRFGVRLGATLPSVEDEDARVFGTRPVRIGEHHA
jgi:hypothetical protein